VECYEVVTEVTIASPEMLPDERKACGDTSPWTGLKCASAAHLGWRGCLGWQMQRGRMLVHCGCRLGAAVADDTIETQGGYGVLAQRAFKGGAAVHRFGGVISHVSIIVLSSTNNPRALGAQPLGAQT
jgi:hypothetical protein